MKIVLAADHGGYTLKEAVKKHLQLQAYTVLDVGTFSEASVDYPDFARLAAEKLQNEEADYGIIFCGTGIGISIAANKFKGIRAALCHDVHTAVMSRKHNDANVLALGGRLLSPEEAYPIVDSWLSTEFEGERHQRRLDKINALDNERK